MPRPQAASASHGTSLPRRPTVIADRYRLVRTLYTGHTSTTYQAWDEQQHYVVALKLLRDSAVQDRSALSRFRRELRHARRVRHPHVARVLDHGNHRERPFLVTEWIDGTDLRTLITTQAPLSAGWALAITSDILEGLRAVHRLGIILRDIKPENVLLTDAGRAVLIDFSIARSRTDWPITAAGEMLGTTGYLAPELARGQPATAQSDLYAVGVLLYELLTGTAPFSGTPDEVLQQHAWYPPVRPRRLNPEIPAWLERVILRALAKDPAKRYRSAGTMRQVLLRSHQQRTRRLRTITSDFPVRSTSPRPRTRSLLQINDVGQDLPWRTRLRRVVVWLTTLGLE